MNVYKIINVNAPIFSQQVKNSYDAFMNDCFSTYTKMGQGAKIISDYNKHAKYSKKWEKRWEKYFIYKDQMDLISVNEVSRQYFRFINALRVDLGIFDSSSNLTSPGPKRYNRKSNLVKDDEIRQVQKIIQPGDILVRGYKNYFSRYFIPGFFDDTGIYLGEVKEKDIRLSESKQRYFKAGKQIVILWSGKLVYMDDIVNFCHCDYLAILRLSRSVESERVIKQAIKNAYARGISYYGDPSEYDFKKNKYDKFLSSELINELYGNIICKHGVNKKTRRFYLFKKKMILIPDDYINSRLQLVWKSDSVTEKRIQKIKS